MTRSRWAVGLVTALLAGWGSGCGDTTLGVDVSVATGTSTATSLVVSVFDPQRALVSARTVAVSGLPGRVVLNLPDVDQRLRIVMRTGDASPLLGSVAVDVQAHHDTKASLVLAAATPDSDGDGIPDSIDNCPDVANPDQASQRGVAGDACGGAPDADLATSPGVFVAVGYGGRRVRSIDRGLTWTDDQQLSASGGNDFELLYTVAWGGGKFLALGWRVMISDDGKTWNDLGTAPLQDWVSSAVYTGNGFVGIGGYGLRVISPDGNTWTEHKIDNVPARSHDGLAFGAMLGGRIVATNNDGVRTYSTDGGLSWQTSQGSTTVTTTHVAFGNGIFVAAGNSATVRSTDGGATWQPMVAVPAAVQAIVFADAHFTAVADGHVLTSADGASWVDHAVPGLAARPLAYGAGTYLLLADQSVRRSTDGLVWGGPVAVGQRTDDPLESITFGGF